MPQGLIDKVPSAVWFALAIIIVVAVAFAIPRAIRKRRAKDSDKIDYSEEDRKIFEATFQIGLVIVIFAILGSIAVLTACTAVDTTWQNVANYFGFNMTVGAAAGAMGALIGFLFGIPRTQSSVSQALAARAVSEDRPQAKASAILAANTNLERVSDWLTTLLLGATLVQIGQIPGWLKDLATFVTSTQPTNEKIVPFIVVYFFSLGFLGTYLITRLYLTSALASTLAILSGDNGASDLKVGEKLLQDALGGDADQLKHSLAVFNQLNYRGNQRRDPKLNAAYARVLAELYRTGSADDPTDIKGRILKSLENAAKDPQEKSKLKDRIASGSLTTGDPTLDEEIKKLLE